MALLLLGAASLSVLVIEVETGKSPDLLFGNNSFVGYGGLVLGTAALLFVLGQKVKEFAKRKRRP